MGIEKFKCHAFVFAPSPNTKLSPVLKVSFIEFTINVLIKGVVV